MEFYWVNIGGTYKTVLDQYFLWAPISSISSIGNEVTRLYWDNVANVKQGDVIFCAYNQCIGFLALAQTDAYQQSKPGNSAFEQWDEMGNRVDVEIIPLDRKIPRDEISQEFITRFDDRTTPSLFNNRGTLNQIYMSHLPADAGMFLLEATKQTKLIDEALIDAGNRSSKNITKTTREMLIQARLGQGKFRQDLITRWEGRCALTGLQNLNLVIASHIVPWALCDNEERLDVNNGLLLAAHIDRLFDQGLISFSNLGELQIASKLNAEDRDILGLNRYTKLRPLTSANQSYLTKHRLRYNFA
ncbi:HNH endonuclease [Duganella sp. sic0402]|uniref:HNH endonuclease n=1 Tax=Duganella sp. sic0402 TaxID=2854786 RepID=UPI001C47092E|nr:HNH endonuclease [Duganella sp. sic0402]MBV7539410.1 HNH endonuclease [Duganella sp. sic0402]